MAGFFKVVIGIPALAAKRLCLAFQFLSVVPTPRIKQVSDRDIRGSCACFPLVGLALGAVLWAVQALLNRVLPMTVSTCIALAVYTLLTGALHLDGLMDTADAIGSRKDRARALEIMKDSRVGAMGVVGAIVVYTGKIAVLGHFAPTAYGAVICAPIISRCCMVLAMMLAPSARGNEGLGGMFAKKISPMSLWLAGIITVLIAIWLNPLWTAVAMLCGSALVTILLTTYFTKRFGGMTGDTYGAINEVIEWTGWILALAF